MKHIKPFSLVITGLFIFISSYAQSIWENPITGTNPNTSNPYTIGDVVDNNLTVSGIGRGTGIIGANANNRYNANNWSLTFDANDYFEFTLTPDPGYEMDLVSFFFIGQASGTGVTTMVVRSSNDNFISDLDTLSLANNNAPLTVDLSALQFQNITLPITFRIYGFGASATGGTGSINEFIFNGVVALPCAVPGLTHIPTNLTCNNDSSGAVDLILTGGTGPFSYDWDGPNGYNAITEDLTGLVAGNYTVTVTANGGCSDTHFVVITEPDAINISHTSDNVSCNSNADGAIDITVTGGVGSFTYNWSNSDITEDVLNLAAGTYTVTVTDNANLCTASYSATITEPAAITSTINPVACFSYTSPAGAILTNTGNYVEIIPAANGCDSTITINLIINSVDPTALVNDHTYTATTTGAAYQWIDCGNGLAPVAGETGQSFTAQVNGTFAVIVSLNGCVDTSACLSTFNTSVSGNIFTSDISLFPNPNNGQFNIAINGLHASDVNLDIFDITGKKVYTRIIGEVEDSYNQALSLKDLQSGIYLLTVHADGKSKTLRFILQ